MKEKRPAKKAGNSLKAKATRGDPKKKEKTAERPYYFGNIKKISLNHLEVYGTISSSLSDKEINSLELAP